MSKWDVAWPVAMAIAATWPAPMASAARLPMPTPIDAEWPVRPTLAADMPAPVAFVTEWRGGPLDNHLADAVLSGATTGAADAVGSIDLSVDLAGQALAQGLAGGSISAEANLTGAASGGGVADGAVSARIDLTGSAAGNAIGEGEIEASADLAGTSAGTGDATAIVQASVDLAGQVSGTSQAQGSVTAEAPGEANLSGGTTGQGEATGTIVASADISGDTAGQALAVGDIIVQLDMHGDTSGGASATGAVSATVDLSGSAGSTAAADGTVAAEVSLEGEAQSDSDAAGTVVASADLAGAATGTGDATGAPETSRAISGAADGAAAAAGGVQAQVNLSGAASGQGSDTAAVSVSATLAGVATGAGTAAGAVTVTAPGPVWVGQSTFASGTTSCSPDFTSSGRTTDDMLLLFVETANRAVTKPSGWELLAVTPASGTAGAAGAVRLTTFYKRSAGTETTVSLTATSADHITASGIVVRGVDWTAVSNLLQNSNDLTNTTYWNVFGGTPTTQISAGNLLWIRGVTDQANAGLWTQSFATLTSSAIYSLLYEEKASTGTQVSAANIYVTAAGLDVDNISADETVTTAWLRKKHKVTLPASVTYSNLGFCVGSALADTLVNLRNVVLVAGDAPLDYAYVPTLAAAGSGVAGISNAVGQTQAATTSVSFPDALAYKNNCLIINVMANDRDAASTSNITSAANANLTSLTTRLDQTVTTGQGGGLAIITGNLATAGSTGNTTATNAASVTNASITLVLASA